MDYFAKVRAILANFLDFDETLDWSEEDEYNYEYETDLSDEETEELSERIFMHLRDLAKAAEVQKAKIRPQLKKEAALMLDLYKANNLARLLFVLTNIISNVKQYFYDASTLLSKLKNIQRLLYHNGGAKGLNTNAEAIITEAIISINDLVDASNAEWDKIKQKLGNCQLSREDKLGYMLRDKLVGNNGECIKIDNLDTLTTYEMTKAFLETNNIDYEEKFALHGSPGKNWLSIIAFGLNPNATTTNASTYGKGSYFVLNDAEYAANYSDFDEQYIGIFKVLCIKDTMGNPNFKKMPKTDQLDYFAKNKIILPENLRNIGIGQTFYSSPDIGVPNDSGRLMILVKDKRYMMLSYILHIKKFM